MQNKVVVTLILFLVISSAYVTPAEGVKIDLQAIISIESGGDPAAVGDAGEVGLCQIMPVVRKSYNKRAGGDVSREDLFDPDVNRKVASWYLHDRIPEMLAYYDVPVTVENVIWTYNAGIGRVVDGVKPEITKRYIAQYHQITK